MKILRITSVILFALSMLVFAGFKGYQMKTQDNDVPVIQCDSDSITLSTKASTKDMLEGVTAYDKKDGDVTQSLVVESISNMDLEGSRTITYAAFDSDKHVVRQTRILKYSDYEPPHFSLSKPLLFEIGDINLSENMTAQDKIDGDLTDKIKYIADDNALVFKEGKFLIEFQVTNSAGQTAFLPASVEFSYPNTMQNTLVDIQLSNYIVYIKKGSNFDAKDYIKSVTVNGEKYDFTKKETSSSENTISKDDITVKSDVNTTKLGVYNVDYTLVMKDGLSGNTKLIVVVEE